MEMFYDWNKVPYHNQIFYISLTLSKIISHGFQFNAKINSLHAANHGIRGTRKDLGIINAEHK